MGRRLVRHHLPAAGAIAVAFLMQWAAPGRTDPRLDASLATGYAAFALIGATLALGPIERRRRGRAPASFDLRRDLGIWAGVATIVHVVLGLQAHMSGRIWLYFVPESFPRPPLRFDLFGFANDTGLLAALIVCLLLAISSDAAVRRLGLPRWKAVQRWNYVGAGLTLAHTLAYQPLENRAPAYLALVVAMTAAVLAARALDLKRPPPA